MTLDENVELVRTAGERLLAKYGGLQGLVRHLQAMDRQRLRSRQPRSKRKPQIRKGKPLPR